MVSTNGHAVLTIIGGKVACNVLIPADIYLDLGYLQLLLLYLTGACAGADSVYQRQSMASCVFS